jgi:cytochrome P450
MLNYPQVLKKLQAELDSVVGRERQPDFDDRDDLPYVQAVVRENWRWRAAAPGGLPHRLEEDEILEGYFLPKGSTIVTLIHEMHMDPSIFPEPDKFKPERWLRADGSVDVETTPIQTFGFGKRVCPGVHLAEASLFLTISNLAWAFNITPYTNELGDPIMPDLDPSNWLASAASAPPHFLARFTPRFPEVVDIMNQ